MFERWSQRERDLASFASIGSFPKWPQPGAEALSHEWL